MRLLAPAATAAVVLAAVVLSFAVGAPAAARSAADPTPTATGSAPITVIIPGPSATPTPRPSSPGGGGGDLPTLPDPGAGACAPGSANADGSPIPASEPDEDAERLELDDDRGLAGDWVIATAGGYLAGERGQVVVYPDVDVLGSYTIGADGVFEARFRIPDDTATGLHVIEVTGWLSGCVTNAEYTVVSKPSPTNWIAQWWLLVVLGGLLLAAISLLVAFRHDVARWFGRGRA